MPEILTEIPRNGLQPAVQVVLLQLAIALVSRLDRRATDRPPVRVAGHVVGHEPRANGRGRYPEQAHAVDLRRGGEADAPDLAPAHPHVAGEVVPVPSRRAVVHPAPRRVHENGVDPGGAVGEHVHTADDEAVANLPRRARHHPARLRGKLRDEIPISVAPLHHRHRVGLHEHNAIGVDAVYRRVPRGHAQLRPVDVDAHHEGHRRGWEHAERDRITAATAESVEDDHGLAFATMAVVVVVDAARPSPPPREVGEPRGDVVGHDLRSHREPPLRIQEYPVVEAAEEAMPLRPVLVVHDGRIVRVRLMPRWSPTRRQRPRGTNRRPDRRRRRGIRPPAAALAGAHVHPVRRSDRVVVAGSPRRRLVLRHHRLQRRTQHRDPVVVFLDAVVDPPPYSWGRSPNDVGGGPGRRQFEGFEVVEE